MKPEELFRLAMSGPTVDESRANDCGSGAGREEGVRGTRRAAQQVRNKGHGPLVPSGYVHGKPFYLYKDGTTPTPSKVGRAAAETGGSRAVREEACGMRRWAEERGRLGAEAAGSLAQAKFRLQLAGPTLGSSDRFRGGDDAA